MVASRYFGTVVCQNSHMATATVPLGTTTRVRYGSPRSLVLTDEDVARLRLLTKWGWLDALDVAQHEPDERSQWLRRESVRRRFAALASIPAGRGHGPLVRAVGSDAGTSVWDATRRGMIRAGVAWDRERPYAVGDEIRSRMAHAASLAWGQDARVWSGREVRLGRDIDGVPVPISTVGLPSPDAVFASSQMRGFGAVIVLPYPDVRASWVRRCFAAYGAHGMFRAVAVVTRNERHARVLAKAVSARGESVWWWPEPGRDLVAVARLRGAQSGPGSGRG